MHLTLIVMCGIPGSGKTTLANQIKNSMSSHVLNNDIIVLLSYDELIPRYFSQQSEAESRSKIFRQTIFQCLTTLLSHPKEVINYYKGFKLDDQSDNIELTKFRIFKAFPHNLQRCDCLYIILDDNMYYRSMREECLKFASNFADSCLAIIYLNCPLSLALTRNTQRAMGERVSDATVTKMWKILEHAKGETSSLTNIMDTLTFTYEVGGEVEGGGQEQYASCLSFIARVPLLKTLYDPKAIETAFSSETVARQRDSQLNLGSVCHRADLIMRHVISKRMREKDSAPPIEVLIRVRKEILLEIKTDPTSWTLGCDGGGARPVYRLNQETKEPLLCLERYFITKCRLADSN